METIRVTKEQKQILEVIDSIKDITTNEVLEMLEDLSDRKIIEQLELQKQNGRAKYIPINKSDEIIAKYKRGEITNEELENIL